VSALGTMQISLVALLAPLCAGYSGLAPSRLQQSQVARVTQTRTCTVQALEPITTTAAAFAAGLVPPSLLLMGKEGELQTARAEADAAKVELGRLREGFTSLIETMELEVDVADAELDELLAAGSRAARARRDEVEKLKEKYEGQIKVLKDLVGDYTDKLELQQNTFNRLSGLAESTSSESLALKQRASLLEERLAAADEQLAKLEAEAKKTWWEKLFNP